MPSRQIILYFIGIALVGGVLLAFGQSWARGFVAGGCAGAVSFGASAVLEMASGKVGQETMRRISENQF
jgi:hypothetical protein